jgi:hypothetical protein
LVVACRMADNVPRERVDPFAICCDHKLPKLRDRCVRARSRGCDRRLGRAVAAYSLWLAAVPEVYPVAQSASRPPALLAFEARLVAMEPAFGSALRSMALAFRPY